MSDSSHKIVFSAVFTLLLLVGGAIMIYLYLEDAPGQGDSEPGDSVSATLDVPDRDTEVVSTTGTPSPESSGDAAATDASPVAVAPPPSGPVSIKGRVMNSETTGISGARIIALNLEEWNGVIEENMAEMSTSGDPIRMIGRMREILSENAEKVARTDSGEDGAYAFHSLADGDYRLFTTHAEHLPDSQTWAIVEPGNPATLDIELLAGAFIAGRVVDGSAQPIANAAITAVPTYRGDSKGIGKMLQAYSKILEGHMAVKELTHRSGADGSFRLGPIEPVAHDVIVKGESFVEARAFRVPPGAEDVVIVVDPGLKIAGTLLGPDSKPFEGADWTLKPTMNADIANNPAALMRADFDILGESTRRGASGKDGKVEISGLEAGSFELSFETGKHPVLKLSIDVREALTDLGEILLDESLSISGMVADSGDAPAAGARVWIATKTKNPFRGGQASEVALVETTADDDGNFTLSQLAPGAYKVQATAPGYAGGAIDEVEAGRRNISIVLADGATLTGRVLDAVDRSPIAGAQLMVMSATRTSGETDDDGYFEVRGLGAPMGVPTAAIGAAASPSAIQHFQVQVMHPDYSVAYQRLSTRADDGAPAPEVLLTPARQISGVVLDQTGVPVKNARVRVVIAGMPEFILMFSPGGSPGRVFSATDGSFSVNLPGNIGRGMNMEVVASHPAYAEGGVELGDVGAQGEVPSDVQIVLSTGSTIEGRVTDSAGQPVAGAQIRVKRPVQLQGQALMMAQMMPQQTGKIAYSKTDGSYRVRTVREGEYQLEVGASGYAKKIIDGLVVTGGEPLHQDVLLDAGGIIQGVVVDSGGEPVAGVEVVAFLDFQQLGEEAEDRMAIEMIRFTGRGTSMTRTGADGSYSLKQLPEGEYTLVARAPGFLPAEQPAVSPGDQAPELVLRRFASLRVTVLDGATRNPAAEFRIQVRRQETKGERDLFGYQPAQTVSDGSGQYTREDLKPGQYHVGVLARGFTPYFKEIRITEGEAAELSATLVPGLAVVGVVTEAEGGEPIAGATVHVNRMQGNENVQKLNRLGLSENYVSNQDGIVTLDSLAEGKYHASVSHTDYFSADENNLTFELPADEGKELNIRMRLAGRLRGKLTNLGTTDPREVSYQLMLTRQEDPPPGEAKTGTSDESRKKKRQSVEWVSINSYDGGTFERSSLRPGKYDVALKKYVYTVEDGRRRSGKNEDIPLGTVEIEPGATSTANFSVPE